jgi:hypothetical protein
MSPIQRPAPELVPRFCPSCERRAPDGHEHPLCPECGATLVPQGYCPVCEDYWRLAADVLCPKHDVPLEAGPASSSERIAAGRPVTWVTVREFPDTLAAAVPQSRLEAEGIATFLEGARMGSPGMYTVATGGVKLQVPSDQAAEARIILSQSWSLPSDEEGDFEDLL